MQKTKIRTGIIAMMQNAIKEAQKEADKQNFEVYDTKSESINIALNNGYWQINEKPLPKCSIAKQSLFDQFLRMKLVKLPIAKESSFKDRTQEIKEKFNHVFKPRLNFDNFPNIEKLTFEPKN